MNAKRYFKFLNIDINATRYHKPLNIPHSTPEGFVLWHNFSHDCWSPYDLRLCAVSKTLGAWSVTWHHSAGTPGAAYPPLCNLWYKINISSNSWYVENIFLLMPENIISLKLSSNSRRARFLLCIIHVFSFIVPLLFFKENNLWTAYVNLPYRYIFKSYCPLGIKGIQHIQLHFTMT